MNANPLLVAVMGRNRATALRLVSEGAWNMDAYHCALRYGDEALANRIFENAPANLDLRGCQDSLLVAVVGRNRATALRLVSEGACPTALSKREMSAMEMSAILHAPSSDAADRLFRRYS